MAKLKINQMKLELDKNPEVEQQVHNDIEQFNPTSKYMKNVTKKDLDEVTNYSQILQSDILRLSQEMDLAYDRIDEVTENLVSLENELQNEFNRKIITPIVKEVKIDKSTEIMKEVHKVESSIEKTVNKLLNEQNNVIVGMKTEFGKKMNTQKTINYILLVLFIISISL